MIAPYARTEVSAITLIGGGVTLALACWLGWWALAPALLTLALLSFYRDPPRRIPQEPHGLLAPADGRVVTIARNEPGPDGPRLRIVIFLSVLNVHVNRAPCAGRVIAVNYSPGLFLNALREDSNVRNEANELVLEPAAPLRGPLRVRQIAGALARRIVCTARAGDTLAAGQRYGMIKLGSRTELSVPDDATWAVCVRVGQAVFGGKTILVRCAAIAPV